MLVILILACLMGKFSKQLEIELDVSGVQE